MTLYECKGANCHRVVDESELGDHIKTDHPNFYYLLEDSLKHGAIKKINFKIFFKKIGKKRRLRA